MRRAPVRFGYHAASLFRRRRRRPYVAAMAAEGQEEHFILRVPDRQLADRIRRILREEEPAAPIKLQFDGTNEQRSGGPAVQKNAREPTPILARRHRRRRAAGAFHARGH